MKRPALTPAPAVKIPTGPNWKLIRNLFIIAGLLIAIFITLEIRREAHAKRERAKQEAIERQKEAREKALADAKALNEARKREAERAALNIRRGTVEAPETSPPVEVTENKNHTTKRVKTQDDTPEPELPPEIASLNTKARDLVLSAGRKRDEQLAENAKKLTWDLDAYLRSLPKSEQINGVTNVNRLKNAIDHSRVPDTILRSDEIEFTRKMEDITTYALRKQKEIDQGFIAAAVKIQSAYSRKLSDAAKAAESAGQKPLHALLNRTLQDAANLGDWLRSLGVDDAEP